MGITENAAYLKGLAEGLKVDDSTGEGKLIVKMLDLISEMAEKIEVLESANEELYTYMEGMAEDLVNMENDFYDDGESDEDYSDLNEDYEDGECIDIYFDTDSPMPAFAVGMKNMKELSALFDKAYNVWRSKRVGYYAEAMSLLYEIIKRIKLHRESYFTDAQAQKISPSHEYMLAHFCERDFDYKEAARQSGLSYDYYKELFIKRFGMSPVKYVRALRIERACELLITGQYSISEVAEASGFENVYYFSNVFKKQLGVSPKSYGK